MKRFKRQVQLQPVARVARMDVSASHRLVSGFAWAGLMVLIFFLGICVGQLIMAMALLHR